MIIRRRVKKEKGEEEDLEFQVEVQRVSADGKTVSGNEEDEKMDFG